MVTRLNSITLRAVIGIVFIVSAFDDGRGERIGMFPDCDQNGYTFSTRSNYEFNVAVDAWNGGAVDGFNMASNNDWTYTLSNQCGGGGLNAVPLLQSEAPEDLLLEADERGTFGSYARVSYYEDTPNAVQASTSCNFEFAIFYQNNRVGNVSVPAVTAQTQVFSEICSQSSSSSSSSNQAAQRRQQDLQRCASVCRGQGGEPSGNSISSFRCQTNKVPVEVCIRVTFSNGQWTAAQGTLPDRPAGASGPGCFIDDPPNTRWSAARLEGAASLGQLTVPVRVRSERDPYLYFLDITDGTGDFGLKTSEKLIIGFTLLVIGLIITLLVCGCCCLIVKFARSFAKGKQEKPSNPVGAALYDVSAKYGNYIPGGTALGQPVGGGTATGVPAAHVSKPPGDYNGGTPYQYGGGAPAYDQGQNSSPYGGGGSPSPYGNPAPYGNNNAGAPPPGYPSAV